MLVMVKVPVAKPLEVHRTIGENPFGVGWKEAAIAVYFSNAMGQT